MHDDFFKVLKKDHKELKDILKQLKEQGSVGSKTEELFMKLVMEAKPHMKAEEKAFYPALAENKEAREDTLESIEEHHVTELVLNELTKMPKGEEQWKAKLSVLKELIEHHIEEEESKIFPQAKKALKADQMKTIMEKFEKEKETVKSKIK